MPSWRPANRGKPDGREEGFYKPLADVDPTVADALIHHYGEVWLPRAGLPMERLPEVGDTVEIRVRDDGDQRVLRLTSWYTGSTYWMYDWDGETSSAVAWIEEVADLQAGNVKTERGRYGPTPWDESA
jgi:hypothetical protein